MILLPSVERNKEQLKKNTSHSMKLNLKSLYLFLTILFITPSILAQESELNTAYNLRFINSKLAFEQLQKIKLNAQKNNQTEIIFESDCFLTLLHLRTKNITPASKSIQNATEKLKKINKL